MIRPGHTHTSTRLASPCRPPQALQRGSLQPQEVVRLARAWVALREMVHAGAQSIAPTAFLNVVILSMSFTLCTFNIMYNVLNGYSKLGAFLTGVGVLSGATLFRIFNSAHLVSSEVSLEGLPDASPGNKATKPYLGAADAGRQAYLLYLAPPAP